MLDRQPKRAGHGLMIMREEELAETQSAQKETRRSAFLIGNALLRVLCVLAVDFRF